MIPFLNFKLSLWIFTLLQLPWFTSSALKSQLQTLSLCGSFLTFRVPWFTSSALESQLQTLSGSLLTFRVPWFTSSALESQLQTLSVWIFTHLQSSLDSPHQHLNLNFNLSLCGSLITFRVPWFTSSALESQLQTLSVWILTHLPSSLIHLISTWISTANSFWLFTHLQSSLDSPHQHLNLNCKLFLDLDSPSEFPWFTSSALESQLQTLSGSWLTFRVPLIHLISTLKRAAPSSGWIC